MAKIKIDHNKCCECYLCETICSLQFSENTVNPKRSRVVGLVRKLDVSEINCEHCGNEPQCIKACLSDALAEPGR
jgi:Fe-S-cluster-containing hydrogenase component 2